MTSVKRLFLLATLGVATFSLSGCGSGGSVSSSATVATTPVKLDLSWAARTKAINAPASALSAVVTITSTAIKGGSVSFPAVDRSDSTPAYTQSYVSPTSVPAGPVLLSVTFFAEKSGKGAVVATASKSYNLATDGTGAGDVLVSGKVQTISVTGSSSLTVGASQSFGISALDGSGNTVAISAGSVAFALKSGSNALSLTNTGQATGLAVGSAEVTATLDGKTSEAFKLSVTAPSGAVAVVASGQGVAVGASQKLVYAFTDATGTPIAVDPNRVTFEVTSGNDTLTLAADGTITGLKIGQAQVKVKIPGLESATQLVVVRPAGATVNVAIAEQQSVKVGESKKLTFTATDANGQALPLGTSGVVFAVKSGGDTLELAADGTVTGKNAGFAVLTATVAGVTSAPQSVFVGDVVTNASGLKYLEMTVGTGNQPQPHGNVTLHYTGTLLDGTKFDSSRDRGTPATFNLDGVIKGFSEGLSTMKTGGRRLLIIPGKLGYGESGTGSIPPNATLVFDCELFEVNP